jgi:hypothetical protein
VPRIRAGSAFLKDQTILDTVDNESTPTSHRDAAEATHQALDGAVSAVDRLDDEPDEILLRHVAANRDGSVSHQSDLSLYSASVFLLQERAWVRNRHRGWPSRGIRPGG